MVTIDKLKVGQRIFFVNSFEVRAYPCIVDAIDVEGNRVRVEYDDQYKGPIAAQCLYRTKTQALNALYKNFHRQYYVANTQYENECSKLDAAYAQAHEQITGEKPNKKIPKKLKMRRKKLTQ